MTDLLFKCLGASTNSVASENGYIQTVRANKTQLMSSDIENIGIWIKSSTNDKVPVL